MLRAALVPALLATACASRPTCPIAPLPREAPFLWRVQKDRGPVVWLYGTLHNQGAVAVPPEAWAALASSARFASELGDLEPDRAQLRELASLPRGEGLDFLLPQDDWWDLRDALIGVIKPDDLRRVRPWYAMSLLTNQVAPSPSPTMDVALAQRADAAHLPIDHFETYAEQLPIIAGAVGIEDLQEAIHARPTMRCDLERMKASYQAGAAERMLRHLNVAGSGKLLTDRNARWLAPIDAYLAGDGAFVAVGLAHLLGDGGLVSIFAAKGYAVTRAPTTTLP